MPIKHHAWYKQRGLLRARESTFIIWRGFRRCTLMSMVPCSVMQTLWKANHFQTISETFPSPWAGKAAPNPQTGKAVDYCRWSFWLSRFQRVGCPSVVESRSTEKEGAFSMSLSRKFPLRSSTISVSRLPAGTYRYNVPVRSRASRWYRSPYCIRTNATHTSARDPIQLVGHSCPPHMSRRYFDAPIPTTFRCMALLQLSLPLPRLVNCRRVLRLRPV